MFKNLLLGFFKGLFGGNLTTIFMTIMIGLMLAVAIPNYSKILHLFGYQTKAELKQDLAISKINTDTAVKANEDLTKTVKVLEGTIPIATAQVAAMLKEEAKTDKIAAVILKKKQKKIEEITASADPAIDPIALKSEARIESIWSAYCSFNEEDNISGCKDIKISIEETLIPTVG